MDFENLFSKPPNPALGKKRVADSEKRIDDEVHGAEVEETQTEKVKWKAKRNCEPNPKKFKHLGNSTASPKSLPRIKSRSKDYDPYSDGETCSQESEDNFDKELQQYIQAKEMANAAQPSLLPEESVKKKGAEDTQQTAKQKNKKSKAGHKKVKQKKMKRKWPGTGDKGPNVSLKNSVSQKKGDQCKFDHDAEIEKKKEMCKYYVQGYCTKGENCLYLHNILYHKIPFL
ncbi:zinc finger CCCH type containing 8 [Cricetulus griseus]